MDKVKFNDGEEAIQGDYNAAQSLAEKALMDALYDLWGNQSGFVGSGFQVTTDTGMVLSVAAGTGFYYDNTEADIDKSKYKVMLALADFAVTVPAADGSNPRKDIICIGPDRLVGEPESRLYMNEDTLAITTESLNKRDRDGYDLLYVSGTPAGTPSEPSTPSGCLKVATIAVAAGATSIVPGNITDQRTTLQRGSTVPASVTFTAGGGTKTAMTTARWGLASAAVGTTIYVVGGNGSGGSPDYDKNEAYDTVANTWTTKAVLPAARKNLCAVAVGTKVYAIGGNNPYKATNEAYDTVANTWASKTAMTTGREWPAAATDGTLVYVIGGYDTGYSQKNEAYDPVANTWTSKANMTTGRAQLCASYVAGKVYAIGGTTGSDSAKCEEYDPVGNTWATKADMTTARATLACGVIASKIYVVGGYNGSYLQTAELYDPAGNSWSTLDNMPTGRSELTATAVNSVLYAIGGRVSGTAQTVNEAYDASANTRTTAAASGLASVRTGSNLKNFTTGQTGVSVGFAASDEYGISGSPWTAGTTQAIVLGG